MTISRRKALVLTGAAAAVALIPSVVRDALEPSISPSGPPLPAWAVGQGGEWNWQIIRAPTAELAKAQWAIEQWGSDEETGGLDVERHEEWDAHDVKTGDVRWFASGLGANCDRCGYETFAEECGRAVKNEVVCEDCMEIADWEIIDPERAEELRAELEDQDTA